MVIARCGRKATQASSAISKAALRQQLEAEGPPSVGQLSAGGWILSPSPWASRAWRVYLNNEREVRRAISYVEQNPIRDGKPPQKWSIVVPYEG